ncbi:hypothetical protein AB0E07_38365, partial [Streptomyces sp. NPDC048002]
PTAAVRESSSFSARSADAPRTADTPPTADAPRAAEAPRTDDTPRADQDPSAAVRVVVALGLRDVGERSSPSCSAALPSHRAHGCPSRAVVARDRGRPAPGSARRPGRHALRAPPPSPGTEATTTPFP